MKDCGISSVELHAVIQEHLEQVEKFGYQDAYPYEWLTWLTEELGELAKAINKNYNDHDKVGIEQENLYHEAIQVATLALKIARARRVPNVVMTDLEIAYVGNLLNSYVKDLNCL